jgi:hypothetical protein
MVSALLICVALIGHREPARSNDQQITAVIERCWHIGWITHDSGFEGPLRQ